MSQFPMNQNVSVRPLPPALQGPPTAGVKTQRRPRVLIAATGCVAANKFGHICGSFSMWADVAAVLTNSAKRFIDMASMPRGITVYADESEWKVWKKVGDAPLHIQLQQWADVLVIAPLSANTLGKIAGGLCDNLVTNIVRAWDYERKAIFVAPAMHASMWESPFTEQQLITIDNELHARLITPYTEKYDWGGLGKGSMADPSDINRAVRFYLEANPIREHYPTT